MVSLAISLAQNHSDKDHHQVNIKFLKSANDSLLIKQLSSILPGIDSRVVKWIWRIDIRWKS